MTAALVVGAIAVIGAVVARVTWHRPGDERHSIETHQQTLDTLRAMADRRSETHPAPPEAPGPATGSGPPYRPVRTRPGPAPRGPVRRGPARRSSVRAPVASPSGNGRQELVFVDDAGAGGRGDDAGRVSARALSKSMPRSRRAHHRGPRPPGRSRRPVLPVAGAVVFLAVVVGVAVALAPSHRAPKAGSTTTRPPRTTARSGHSHTSPTTVAQVRPTSATSSTADYGAPSTGYTVDLRATGLCWVDATAASTGDVVWTGTLQTGQSQSIPATGSLIVRLGAANDVTVTMNGEPVVLPSGFQSPFNMSFVTT